jgi:hydroxymethylpyrimidine pyrophosphatase-like HAD family hydrolase
LLDARGEVHLRDRQAIAQLLSRDIVVTLCTGRMYSGTRQIVEQLKLVAPVACVDGCHVVEARTHHSLLSLPISADGKAKLRPLLSRADLAVFAFAEDTISYDTRGLPYLDYLSMWSAQMVRVSDLFEDKTWDRFNQTTALVAIGPRAVTEIVADGIQRNCSDAVQLAYFPLLRGGRVNRWVLIIRRAGVDKGTAVCWLAEHFGIPLSDVVAIGDWINDIPMFEVAGESFVMGQAPQEVKAAARNQLRSTVYTGGGIAEAAACCGLL